MTKSPSIPKLESAVENLSPARWMVFGVGTTEPEFRGGIVNIGAAAIELLADQHRVSLKDCGPIQLGVAFDDALLYTLRLVRPNTSLKMGEDAVSLTKTKIPFDSGCAVLIYGDPSYDLGMVKIKHKGGLAAGDIANYFLKVYGTKQVIRVRIGIGSKRKAKDPVSDEAYEKLLAGVYLATEVIHVLLTQGFDAASKLANKASNRNRNSSPKHKPDALQLPIPNDDAGGAL